MATAGSGARVGDSSERTLGGRGRRGSARPTPGGSPTTPAQGKRLSASRGRDSPFLPPAVDDSPTDAERIEALENAAAVLRERRLLDAERTRAKEAELRGEVTRLTEEKAVLVARAGRSSALEQKVRHAYCELEGLAASRHQPRMPADRLAAEHPHALLEYMKVHVRLYVMGLQDEIAAATAEAARLREDAAAAARRLDTYAADVVQEKEGVAAEHAALAALRSSLSEDAAAQAAAHDAAVRQLQQDKRDLAFENERLAGENKKLKRTLEERGTEEQDVQSYERRVKVLEDEIAKLQTRRQADAEASKASLHGQILVRDERLAKERIVLARAEENVEKLSRANKNLTQCVLTLRGGALPKDVRQGKGALTQDTLDLLHGKATEKMMVLKSQNAGLRNDAGNLKRQLKQAKKKLEDMQHQYENLFALHLRAQEERERARTFAKFAQQQQQGGDGMDAPRTNANSDVYSTDPDAQDIMLEYYRAKVAEMQHESKVLSRHVKRSVLQEQREKQTFEKERAHFEAEMRRMQRETDALHRNLDRERESWRHAAGAKAGASDGYKAVVKRADAVTSPYRKGARDPQLSQAVIANDAITVTSPYKCHAGTRANTDTAGEVSARVVDAARGYCSPFAASCKDLMQHSRRQRESAAHRPSSAPMRRGSPSASPAPEGAGGKDVSLMSPDRGGDAGIPEDTFTLDLASTEPTSPREEQEERMV